MVNQNLVNPVSVEKAYNELLETFKIKNANYGNSFEKSLDKYGLIAALTRLSDKFNRAEELLLKKDRKFSVGDESIRDTLMDMANYCVMTSVYLDGKSALKGGEQADGR